VSNEGRKDRSATDFPAGSAAGGGADRPVPPDDRLTAVIPAVTDGPGRDPVEAVKALNADPAARPVERDPLEAVTAALNGSALRSSHPDDHLFGGRRRPERRPPEPALPGIQNLLTDVAHRANWRWARRGVFAAAAALLMLPLITFAMAYLIVDVPRPGDIRTNQVSTILASDGSELAKIVPPEGNRVDVNLSQVPVHVRQAVIAAEDRNFYSNPGFSFTGFARAFKNNLFGGDTQGGSTITQQYVKNALVGSQRAGVSGLVRKAKELVIATKMSGEWHKDDVLQAYLNIVYFGRGAYGIASASKAYFNKPVEELTVAEGALLAALIQRPSTLDPAVDLAGAIKRWNWVLDGMVDTKALPAGDRAAQVFPPTLPADAAREQNQTSGPNGLIERQVTRELLDLFNIDERTLNTQGLQITTTVDPPAQQAAEKAV
jgi:membrane peptidoglycan carboxypeptidase